VKKNKPKKSKPRDVNKNVGQNTPAASIQTSVPPESKSKQPKYRRFLRIAEWSLGPPLAVLAFVYGIWGPPWPTEPIFAPGAPSFGSPFAVPFNITNKSALFDMNNLSISCGLASRIQGEPPTGGTVGFGQPGKPIFGSIAGASSRLKAGETRSYTCAAAALRIDVGPNPKILFAEMTFESQYDSPWRWGDKKIVRSPTLFLDMATIPPQWKSSPLN
jgi:hypothetical protein